MKPRQSRLKLPSGLKRGEAVKVAKPVNSQRSTVIVAKLKRGEAARVAKLKP